MRKLFIPRFDEEYLRCLKKYELQSFIGYGIIIVLHEFNILYTGDNTLVKGVFLLFPCGVNSCSNDWGQTLFRHAFLGVLFYFEIVHMPFSKQIILHKTVIAL